MSKKIYSLFISLLSFAFVLLMPLQVAFAAVVPPASVAPATETSVFGTIKQPKGVAEFNKQAGGTDGIGIIIFASNLIKIVTIVAGIIVFVNFIMAGYSFITSDGNANANEKVKNQITMSVIGLVLIVLSYTIVAVLSFIIFGDASYILDPKITGPSAVGIPPTI